MLRANVLCSAYIDAARYYEPQSNGHHEKKHGALNQIHRETLSPANSFFISTSEITAFSKTGARAETTPALIIPAQR